VTSLADLDLVAFSRALESAWPGAAGQAEVAGRLHAHYAELRRWAARVDLIGPGVAREIFERHYAESLAALSWMPTGEFRLVDVGSGAGFPGFVLAAARPDAEAWLVEPRQKRRAFLAAAARRAQLAVHLLDARVAAPHPAALPEAIDVVTLRALRLSARDLGELANRLAPGGRILCWEGAQAMEIPGELVAGRRRLLAGSAARYLAEYRLRGDLAKEESSR